MFTKNGIETTIESVVKYDKTNKSYRTTVPVDKLYILTGKIKTAEIIGNKFSYNCGGQALSKGNRLRLSASTVKGLKLTHDSVLLWRCSYTSTGIKITLEVKK